MAEEQVLVKGPHLLGLLKYTGERIGPEGRVNLLKSLDDEDQKVFFKSADSSEPQLILLAEWYPYKAFKNFLNAIIREVGNGDVNLSKKIGHWGALRDFDPKKGIYKFFTKEAYKSDRTVLYRATPMIWGQMYNKGKIEAETVERGREATLTLRGFPEITEASCLLIAGWIEQGSPIVSGFNLNVDIKYKPANEIDCEFKIFQN
jgi:hypothetical protein